jgi:hypothetical protein
MSAEECPEEAKVQEKEMNSNEEKMEPAPEDQKEQDEQRGREGGGREETHSPHGRQETTEASAAAAVRTAGVELWPRVSVPRGVSPQLTDSDNTSSHSPRSVPGPPRITLESKRERMSTVNPRRRERSEHGVCFRLASLPIRDCSHCARPATWSSPRLIQLRRTST